MLPEVGRELFPQLQALGYVPPSVSPMADLAWKKMNFTMCLICVKTWVNLLTRMVLW